MNPVSWLGPDILGLIGGPAGGLKVTTFAVLGRLAWSWVGSGPPPWPSPSPSPSPPAPARALRTARGTPPDRLSPRCFPAGRPVLTSCGGPHVLRCTPRPRPCRPPRARQGRPVRPPGPRPGPALRPDRRGLRPGPLRRPGESRVPAGPSTVPGERDQVLVTGPTGKAEAFSTLARAHRPTTAPPAPRSRARRRRREHPQQPEGESLKRGGANAARTPTVPGTPPGGGRRAVSRS